MDDGSFDNLVRQFAASVQSRRTLALATVGLALSVAAPLVDDTEAAARQRGKRGKSRRGGKGKQGGPGKGHQGDCGQPKTCPRDPETGNPGYLCPDGLCSCGGACCEKGYACFSGGEPKQDVCCFDDAGAVEIPEGVEFAVCPGAEEPRDTCCKSNECENGACRSFITGRYRRNPR
mgnify:CR=1 FL=1